MSVDSAAGQGLRADADLWFEVTEGLDPVEHLRASRLYFAIAEARVALDAWVDVIAATEPHRVIDRVNLAYDRMLVPFELWLESRLARTHFDLAVATPISAMADGVHDMALAAAAASPSDRTMLRVLRQQHLVEVLKPRLQLGDQETIAIDDDVLEVLVSQVKHARSIS